MTSLKNSWFKLSARLDAMTLRERALIFVTATGVILFLLYTLAVEPMLTRQTLLLAQIQQQQNQIGSIDAEIAARAQGFVVDPDAPGRAQLHQAQADIERLSTRLLAVQKGLVAPQKIAPLLEHLLRGNGKLTLVSLKTLPVTGMNDATAAPVPPSGAAQPTPAAPAASAVPIEQALQQSALQKTPPAAGQTALPPAGQMGAQPAGQSSPSAAAQMALPAAGQMTPQPGSSAVATSTVKPRELLYRHGVEIVLQGGYLDMINYMQALEALPVQLFWGGARLDAQQYPEARLTLTLYTLSLDEKWMKL